MIQYILVIKAKSIIQYILVNKLPLKRKVRHSLYTSKSAAIKRKVHY